MSKKEISLFRLFMIFLRINAITFGGGYTIVAVLSDEFVSKKRLLTEDEMLDLTAIGQSGPGAMAINTSILVGYRLQGVTGAVVCMLASIIPSLVSITIISFFYQEFRENFFVNAALRGMSGVISAVLVITTINMAKGAMKNHPIFSTVVMAGAFVASFIFHINAATIILIVGLMGLVVFSLISEDDLK